MELPLSGFNTDAFEGAVLIQMRDVFEKDGATGERWVDYGYADTAKAGRFLGWGNNADHYRAVDPNTLGVLPLAVPPPEFIAERTTIVTVWAVIDGAALTSGDGIQVTIFDGAKLLVGDRIAVTLVTL